MIFGVGVYYIAQNAEKRGGLAAWRVINLFLGGTTVGMGIIFLIFIGTPREVWWLSKREKTMAHARLVSNATGGGEQHPWRWEHVRECLRDPQYWHAIAYNFLSCIPNGAISTFQTLIYKSFGFTVSTARSPGTWSQDHNEPSALTLIPLQFADTAKPLESVLYQLPGNAVTFVIILVVFVLVFYFPKSRFPFCIVFQLLPIAIFLFVGLAPASTNKWAKWGVFLPIATFSLTTFLLWPLMSVNIAGRSKKTFFGATSLISYCAGNVVGTQIFLPRDAPKYIHGLVACAIVMAVNTVNIILWWWYYVRTNRRRDRIVAESGLTKEQCEHANRVCGETDVTDMKNIHFRYAC